MSSHSTTRWRFGAKGRVGVAVGALVLGLVTLGGAGAASTSATPFTSSVHPIAVKSPFTAATPQAGFPGPGLCAAVYGLACYTPQVLHAAYNIPWTINGQLAGTGKSIAIIDSFGDPTVAADLATYDTEFGLPAANLHVWYPQGPVTFDPTNNDELGWANEISLDVQTAHDLAPGATINLVIAKDDQNNDLNVAQAYAVTHRLGDVMSMSYGSDEATDHADLVTELGADLTFKLANLLGISVFASSGDSGSSDGNAAATASFPASDPNVTSTGGTDLFVPSDSDPTGASTDYSYGSETVWNDSDPSTCPFGCYDGVFGATGGAPSVIFPAPDYQRNASHMKMRSTSDVSFNASVYTGTLIYIGFNSDAAANGFYFFGGTSEASPSWAAITADLDQATHLDLGNLNPVLYGLAQNHHTYSQDFHDVTVGNNQLPFPTAPGYSAGTGYDIPTGLGSPNVTGLLNSLAPWAHYSMTQPS